MVNHFLSKSSRFCIARTIRFSFVQISQPRGPNTYQIIYLETLDFQCRYQQWLYKVPDRKIIFCSKFAVKTLPATVANANIGSLKSLHTLFDKYLDHMLVKFEQNCMVRTQ